MKFIQSLLAVALFSSVAFNAHATVYRFTFSDSSTEYVQAGSGGVTNPTSAFAYLDYDTVLNRFRLYDNTADSYLATSGGNDARLGITGIAFYFPSASAGVGGVVSYNFPSTPYDSGSISGLTPIPATFLPSSMQSTYNRVYLATTSDRLVNGESDSFIFAGFTNNTFNALASSNGNVLASSIAVRVSNGNSSRVSWFTASSVAAIPEPETYAMFLAGLGLLGFVSRRKTAA